MNLTGGELTDVQPAGHHPGDALLTQESFGPAEASNRRRHGTSHRGQALRFARRRAATFLTLTATYAGSLADVANTNASDRTVRS